MTVFTGLMLPVSKTLLLDLTSMSVTFNLHVKHDRNLSNLYFYYVSIHSFRVLAPPGVYFKSNRNGKFPHKDLSAFV